MSVAFAIIKVLKKDTSLVNGFEVSKFDSEAEMEKHCMDIVTDSPWLELRVVKVADAFGLVSVSSEVAFNRDSI